MLSDLHKELAKIELRFDAERLNEIANHPDVHPFIRGKQTGELDLSNALDNSICLIGSYGAEIFVSMMPGIFEVHSMCLPEGRGLWMVNFVNACLHWMFTRTQAMELVTRCPTRASKALARSIGGKKEFTNPRGWVLDDKEVPADIYALRIQDWMMTAPGLEERGRWFHERIEQEYAKHGEVQPPHDDIGDEHDRYTGLACEMMLGEQPDKAAIFYNRWAELAGYDLISIAVRDPLTVDIGGDLLVVGKDDFWMPVCRRAA